jgi:aminopeptidase-like protein
MKSKTTFSAENIFDLAKTLFPLNRSLTGNGVRETLKIIKNLLPELKINEVKSGSKAFDWTIPDEWNIDSAYIIGPDGKKFCDYSENNLHLVGYSKPISIKLKLQELESHLYSLPEQPNAIPYVTSYYEDKWGFCISQNDRDDLVDGDYEVFIKGSKQSGSLTYADLVLKGRSKKEILISTYICHPSMANNEISGICVSTFLAKWISEQSDRFYTYRFIFIPETIGSIYYLSRYKKYLQKRVIAGFNVTCIGDDRNYSFLPSRDGKTLSDRIAKHVLGKIVPSFKVYSWSDRGSDERQYCAPKIDLPIATIMRTKYGEYPEYHTSLDALGTVVTKEGLEGGLTALKNAILCIESNYYPLVSTYGEPHLSKRNLYPKTSIKSPQEEARLFLDLLTWADGTKSLLDIAEILGAYMLDVYPYLKILASKNLIKLNRNPRVKFFDYFK